MAWAQLILAWADDHVCRGYGQLMNNLCMLFKLLFIWRFMAFETWTVLVDDVTFLSLLARVTLNCLTEVLFSFVTSLLCLPHKYLFYHLFREILRNLTEDKYPWHMAGFVAATHGTHNSPAAHICFVELLQQGMSRQKTGPRQICKTL